MGPIGMQEMMLLFLLALLLFGPKKLPELGKMLGKGLTEFRRAKSELKSTFETHMRELEKEVNVDEKKPAPYYSSSTASTPNYNHYDEYGQYEPNYSSPSSSEEHPALETGTPPSAIASETATQDAEAHREASSASNSPVNGTVPRVNGVASSEELSSTTHEGHPA